MSIKFIGIIYNGDTSQAAINREHAEATGEALKDVYRIEYYNVSDVQDITRLINHRQAGKLDLVFNNAAGKRGGDGTVEGMLDLLKIPYVGSGVLATAVSFDKNTTKQVVHHAGVTVIDDVFVDEYEWNQNRAQIEEKITKSIGYPVVVKASGGSDSIGTSYVETPTELEHALKQAFAEDSAVIVEKFIDRLTETTCMVYGNGSDAEAFVPVEFVFEDKIMDLDVKSNQKFVTREYIDDKRLILEMKEQAKAAHMACGCHDYSRTDFVIDKNGKLYFLEINPHAGLGFKSPTVFAAHITHKWSHADLIKGIVDVAVRRLGL